MNISLNPVSPEWLHTFLLQPFLEGAERINRAIEGIDLHSLSRPVLSLKERVISALTGAALLFCPLPFVNTIIWLAWQTFGHPEILSDPFSLESDAPNSVAPLLMPFQSMISLPPLIAPSPRLQQQIPLPAPVLEPQAPFPLPALAQPVPVAVGMRAPIVPLPALEAAPRGVRVEKISYVENGSHPSTWVLEHDTHQILGTKNCSKDSVTVRYRPDWRLLEYSYRDAKGTADVRIQLKDSKCLHIAGKNGNESIDKKLVLEKDYPWIQQVTFGFKNFALCKEETVLDFYGIRPDTLGIAHLKATKKGEEELPPFGKMVKLEIRLAGFLFQYIFKAELWLDPQSGVLKKIDFSSPFTPKSVTEFVQNDSSLGSAHR